MKRKKEPSVPVAAGSQLRSGTSHPFSSLRGYVPLGGGEERIYRQVRQAVPVLDAAIGKLVRLSSGFDVKCPDAGVTERLRQFLAAVNCGRGQVGIDSFFTAYMDSLLTYGRAVGEMVISGGKLRAVCWGDVTQLEVQEGESMLDIRLCGPDGYGNMRPLPYQNLLLFTTFHPEPGNPYGVSILRGMPFLADVLMKIYNTIGVNWERAGNVRYSVICKPEEGLDPVTAQERGNQIAREWAKAMEEGRSGMVRDFVAVGDVQIKVIGADGQILDSQAPVRQILEQLVAKTGLPPFLLGLNWTTTERMSGQQADLLTSELWALRRTVQPALERICRMWLMLEGLEPRVEIVWDEISLQDIAEEAQAQLHLAQAENLRSASVQ